MRSGFGRLDDAQDASAQDDFGGFEGQVGRLKTEVNHFKEASQVPEEGAGPEHLREQGRYEGVL